MNGECEMEDRDIRSFMDEDGNKVDYEAIAKIYLEQTEYIILSPLNSISEDDAFIFRVDKEDEKEVLNLVEDDDEFMKVKKQYKNLLYNEK